MLDTVRKTGVRRLAAEMEVRLAGMADRPLADAVVQLEQRGLVGHFRARLGRDQTARPGGRDRRLLIAGALAHETARTDRTVLQCRTGTLTCTRMPGRAGRSRCRRTSFTRVDLR